MAVISFSTSKSLAGFDIGLLKISRPEAMNALNKAVLEELDGLLSRLKETREVRALVLTGEGEKAFVAGADIKEMEKLDQKGAQALAVRGQSILQKIEDLPFPVIAAVNGFALGGGLELALACDFILASNQARWGLPEVNLGLIPGYGGTQRLSRVAGRAVARRVALSGEIFTADQGRDWGVFVELFEPADLLPKALKLAETLAARAPLALGLAKESINHGHDLSLEEGLRLEADLFSRTFATEDHNEGIKAFVEKRLPQFKGR